MGVVCEKTKISKGFQVVIPSKIRKEFGLEPEDEVVWILEDKKLSISFRKKKKLSALIGKIDMGETDPQMIDEVVYR
ncbi:MAG: AbrB/MazE/SpoVT family DNA-binding domain-containing protein [Candidatus Hydrothermarchaeota archaeon]